MAHCSTPALLNAPSNFPKVSTVFRDQIFDIGLDSDVRPDEHRLAALSANGVDRLSAIDDVGHHHARARRAQDESACAADAAGAAGYDDDSMLQCHWHCLFRLGDDVEAPSRAGSIEPAPQALGADGALNSGELSM